MASPSQDRAVPVEATTALRLDGRVAIVTGAARGQGRAITHRLTQAGAHVVATDVREEVHTLADEHPGLVSTEIHDVGDGSSWARVVASAAERRGRLDILVNNAGVLRRRLIDDETAEGLEATWRTNCLGPFLGIKAALPHLRAAPAGAVVNTLSTAATQAFTYHAAYASSKWALRGLTKVAALELAADGIRVNAVLPGPVLTPMTVRDDDPGAAERMARTPLGRAGVPADIADLVLFLVSDQASFVTGAEVAIDGGQTAGTRLQSG